MNPDFGIRPVRWLLLLGMIAGTVASFWVPPAKSFPAPELARIVFFHLPCALVSTAFIFGGAWFAFRFARTKDPVWDERSQAAMELAFLLGLLTLVTGMIFSKVQWGAWWNWDPRQTSYLLAMLILAAYFALRSALADPVVRAANAAAYLLAATLPLMFLIFVFPKLRSVTSLHPNVLRDGGFDPTYRTVFLSMLFLVAATAVTCYRLRTRQARLATLADDFHGKLAHRDHSADPRVVRPVALSRPGGAEAPAGRDPAE